MTKRLKKAICFSLWGNQKVYCWGATENVRLSRKYFPGWDVVFYYDPSVPPVLISELKKMGAITHLCSPFTPDFQKLFWRMSFPFGSYDVFICRDTDSRPGLRDMWCVEEWLKSDKTYHIVRDGVTQKSAHYKHVQGGLIGFKTAGDKGILKNKIIDFMIKNKDGRYAVDEEFLNNECYEIMKKDALIHCTKFNHFEKEAILIPDELKQEKGHYMGQKILDNGIPLMPV